MELRFALKTRINRINAKDEDESKKKVERWPARDSPFTAIKRVFVKELNANRLRDRSISI